MLVRKLPSALGGKGAAFLVSFLLLRPSQHADVARWRIPWTHGHACTPRAGQSDQSQLPQEHGQTQMV